MSFGESVFPLGFNQKIVKGDLFVKGNHRIPPRDQCGKVPEDSRRLSTEAGFDPLTCAADQPHLEAAWPLGPPVSLHIAMSVPHCLLRCIYAVL